MNRPASLIAAIFFLVLAIFHVLRFILGIEVVAAGVEIPLWPSAVAAVALIVLSIWILKERGR
ncbi:MAG: hypothetical protein ABFD50_23190 [Smithella sp.]